MEKIDLFKQFKSEYKATSKPALVDIASSQYLAIDGKGQPGGDQFELALGAMYSIAYTIKMTRKVAGLGDYVIGKLQAQWWCDNGCFSPDNMDNWLWRLLIRTPDCVCQTDLDKAVEVLTARKKAVGAEKVYLTTVNEGLCVQMMHIGPYETECQTIAIMHDFININNLQPNGYHHAIYLSDPRRVAPENLKTILRQPVRKI